MIKLSGQHLIKLDKSSKGNQLKWKVDGYWYKADHLGYEALAEYIVSHLLMKTNISNFTIVYELEKIAFNGKEFNGCISKNFLSDNTRIITLSKLFLAYLSEDIYMECESPLKSEKDCIKYVVDNTVDITGLTDFGKYLTFILELDYLFLNEDRHFNNIAVEYNTKTKKFEFCKIFDFGASLFSDTTISFDINKSVNECLDTITSKPFSPSFKDQVDAARELYGKQLEVQFTSKDIDELLEYVKSKQMYDNKILKRVEKTLKKQLLTFLED